MALEVRTVTDDEVPAFRAAMMIAFGDDADTDPDGDRRIRALVPATRRWAAFDDAQLVATAGTFDHAIGVPGGHTLPMAGLTMVTVRATHRRRGILRQLIDHHLADARTRGFPVSGLWASEAGIYGRFGYGLAASCHLVSLEDARTIELRAGALPVADPIEWIDEPAAREQLPAVYARATAARPGALRRAPSWWQERRFGETPRERAGASRRRHVVARRDGQLVGYLQYRQRGAFEPTRPNGKLEIVELIGIDPRAELSLWQYALRVDLYPKVGWWNAPVDDVLAWAVTDPRRIVRQRTDTLWLRIDEVATTLASRSYGADGALVFESHGATWRLAVEAGRGACTRSSATASLRFGDTALASCFLGGEAPSVLARAGLIAGDPAALALADRMFGSSIAPWCAEVF